MASAADRCPGWRTGVRIADSVDFIVVFGFFVFCARTCVRGLRFSLFSIRNLIRGLSMRFYEVFRGFGACSGHQKFDRWHDVRFVGFALKSVILRGLTRTIAGLARDVQGDWASRIFAAPANPKLENPMNRKAQLECMSEQAGLAETAGTDADIRAWAKRHDPAAAARHTARADAHYRRADYIYRKVRKAIGVPLELLCDCDCE